MVNILTIATKLRKRKATSKTEGCYKYQAKSKENRRQSNCILQVNVLAGIQAPARWKLLGMIKRLLT